MPREHVQRKKKKLASRQKAISGRSSVYEICGQSYRSVKSPVSVTAHHWSPESVSLPLPIPLQHSFDAPLPSSANFSQNIRYVFVNV